MPIEIKMMGNALSSNLLCIRQNFTTGNVDPCTLANNYAQRNCWFITLTSCSA